MKLKTIIISFFWIIGMHSMFSQIEWFPTGAKWYYSFNSFIGSGLTTLEVLDEDTLISNHNFRKVLSTTLFSTYPDSLTTFKEFLYVFEENQVVFGYDQWVGVMPLYDFNAKVGDTLDIQFGGENPYPFVVDSVGEMTYNGTGLAFQDIRFPSLFKSGEFDKMRVVEGMGSIYSHLFHDHTVIQPFDFPTYYFRCYADFNIGLVKFIPEQVACDFIPGLSSVNDPLQEKPTLFPNPTSNLITVEMTSASIENVLLVDLLGRVRSIQPTNSSAILKMDMSRFENGLYFLIGEDKNGEIRFTEKITKCGR